MDGAVCEAPGEERNINDSTASCSIVNVVVLVGVCGRESSRINVEVVEMLLMFEILLLD